MPQLLTMSTHIIKLTSADYQKMFNTGPIFSIKFTDFLTQIVRYLFVKKKVFNYSELHFSEVTSYKIDTLTIEM